MTNLDKEKIAKRLKAAVEAWEKNPERMQSGYEYEKTFVEMWRGLGKEIFQQSVGKVPASKNTKKK